MSKFLSKILSIFLICYSGNLFATYEADEKDLNLSKKSFLVSGSSYEVLKQKKQGALTLCFTKADEASLVFEMFLPKIPNETSLKMIRYSLEDDCCGGGKSKVIIEGHTDTLKKSYRSVRVSNVSGDKEYTPASHNKYASWIVSNDDLLKGLIKAEEDQKTNYNPSNGITYVARIMRSVGLDVDFGWWRKKPSNLKLLVNSYIQPQYNYKY